VTLEPRALRTVAELATVTFLIGILIGFIGARYTGRASPEFLRSAVVIVPVIAGAMLLFL
jgi:hypothetical protein